MSKDNRIYLVTTPGKPRLVRAISVAAAIKHVVAPDYTAEVASADDVAFAMKEGADVENAPTLKIVGEAA